MTCSRNTVSLANFFIDLLKTLIYAIRLQKHLISSYNTTHMQTNVPPIKCQGIKTKLVPFIIENINIDAIDTWIEPFMGSGVVALNVLPKRAILADKNQSIIDFYTGIQKHLITPEKVKSFLEFHGEMLRRYGEQYYKSIRGEYNNDRDPLKFLFLNRSDFNGMIRFNRKGEFNVPFCKKPERFSKAYITKICNQIKKASTIIDAREWSFYCQPWQDTIGMAHKNDFIYLDPPYIGRDTSYVGEWPEQEAELLAKYANSTEANVGLSMWKENKYRTNPHLMKCWGNYRMYEFSHFYHLGAKESNRQQMAEIQ